jgi:hypothetical protein
VGALEAEKAGAIAISIMILEKMTPAERKTHRGIKQA